MNGKIIECNAMNFEVAKDGVLPDRILLIKDAAAFDGSDGRHYENQDPQVVVDGFHKNNRQLPVDIEHSTQLQGKQGLPAPAVAWITDLVLEGRAVWALVSWTDEGKKLLLAKKYKYYSPAYSVTEKGRVIVGVVSVGLTNVPNLEVPALNRKEENGGEEMDNKKICGALGLKPEATEDEVILQLNSMKESSGKLEVALNRATEAEARAKKAEDALAKIEAEKLKTEINSTVEQAVTDGKILPYQKDFYVTSLNSREGLESFKQMIAKAPDQMPSGSQTEGKKPAGQKVELNADEKAVMAQLGTFSDDEKKKMMEELTV